MPVADDLQTAKANLAAKLAAVSANPQPTYSVGGQSVSWSDYFAMLTRQLEEINKLLAAEDPYELRSQAL